VIRMVEGGMEGEGNEKGDGGELEEVQDRGQISPFCPSPKVTSVPPAGKLLKLSSWLGS
jgi:hypothetical protein